MRWPWASEIDSLRTLLECLKKLKALEDPDNEDSGSSTN